MNEYQLKIIPSLWQKAHKGEVLAALESEISDYHRFAKNPDTGDSFRAFYSITEVLHAYLAKIAARQYSQFAYSKSPRSRADSLFSASSIQAFLDPANKVIILKGTISLAHGDVLRKQILNVDPSKRCELAVVFIDYPPSFAALFSKQYGVFALGLGKINNLKDKYTIIALYASCQFSNNSTKEFIWWGIPFGMIFTYQLAGELSSVDGKSQYSLKKSTTSYLTVKHHYSFSSTYLDRIYTSTPLVEGFSTYFRPSIAHFFPAFYEPSSLASPEALRLTKYRNLLLQLNELKASGKKLISSVSRVEKTCGEDYLRCLDSILSSVPDASLLCFGKTMPKEYFDLSRIYGSNRVIYVGWLDPVATVAVIQFLDLFIDPFPFGAGMTFVSAAFQKVPIVSSIDYVSQSPSTISIIYYEYKRKNSCITNQLLKANLFGSSQTLADRSIRMLNSSVSSNDHIEQMHELVKMIFLAQSTSILA